VFVCLQQTRRQKVLLQIQTANYKSTPSFQNTSQQGVTGSSFDRQCTISTVTTEQCCKMWFAILVVSCEFRIIFRLDGQRDHLNRVGQKTGPLPLTVNIFRTSDVVEFGEAIKNPAYRIPQTEYSGCLDISAHA